jgi:hypothetical protein
LTAKSKSRKSDTQRLVETLAHPIRLEALRIFSYGVASPSEVASELHVTLGSLTYHVKVLRNFGCIESVRTAQVRGATEHFYRAVLPPHFEDEEWAKLPQAKKSQQWCSRHSSAKCSGPSTSVPSMHAQTAT